MKTRELYSVVFKIIGLIATWQFVTMFFTLTLSGFGVLTMLFSPSAQLVVGYLIATVFVLLLQTGIPLVIAIYCLFHTDKLLRVFKLEDDSTLDLVSERKVLYHLVVLSFGVYLFADGASEFLSVDYKTDTSSQLMPAINAWKDPSNAVRLTESKTQHVNFVAFIELLIGVVVLLKSTKIAGWVMNRMNSKEEK